MAQSVVRARLLGATLRQLALALLALIRLLLLVGLGAGMALLLLAVDGPPRLPARWPSPGEILFELQLGAIPTPVILYLLAQLGWLLLGYLALVCLLEVLASILEVVAAGTGGVRRLRQVSNTLAPGFVRQPVASVVTALLLLWLNFRPPAPVAAAPIPAASSRVLPHPPDSLSPTPGATAPLVVVREADGTLRPLTAADAVALDPGTVRHVVVPGDTLVDLATRYYGDSSYQAAMQIFHANEGRRMPGGRIFDNPRLLLPGEMLYIPERSGAPPVELIDHVVQPGDTLRAIAQRYLGDEMAWPAIFEANRGRPAPQGRALTDPDLIWPGMTLRIPIAPDQARAVNQPDAGPPSPPPAAEPTSLEPAPVEPAPVEPAATAEAVPAEAGVAEAPAAPRPPAPAPPATPTVPTAAPPDSGAEAAAAQAGWARLQAEAEAEARANAKAAAAARAAVPTPEPAAVQATPATVASTPPPGAGEPVTPTPSAEPTGLPTAAPVAIPAEPATADDIPLAGLLASASLLLAAVGAYHLRRRLAQSPEPHRALVPLHFPAPPTRDPQTGLGSQPLAPQAAQRRHGLETDPRPVVTGLVLGALARAGWPDAQVISLCAGELALTVRLHLGAPPPADLDPLLEQLEEALHAGLTAHLGERDELWLTLTDLAAGQAWTAGRGVPEAPLLTVGQTDDGVLSVAVDALDGGLLMAGQHAPVALERAILSLVALYPPTDLRLLLLAGDPLASNLAALPHLLHPPVAADTEAAQALLEGLHEELRCRQTASGDAADELILLVVAGPPPRDGLALRDLVRDGSRFGIYTLVTSLTPDTFDAALLDACPGRLITRLDNAADSVRLTGRPGAETLEPGQAWWYVTGEPVQPVRVLRIAPEDRQALLTSMAEVSTTPPRRLAPDDQADAAPGTDVAEPAGPVPPPAPGAQPTEPTHPAASPAASEATGSGQATTPPGHAPQTNGHRPGPVDHAAVQNGDHGRPGTEVTAMPAVPLSLTGRALDSAGPGFSPTIGQLAARSDPAPTEMGSNAAAMDATHPVPRSPAPDATTDPATPPFTASTPDQRHGPAAGPADTRLETGAVPADAAAPESAADHPLAPPPGAIYGPRPGQLCLRLFGPPRLFDAQGRAVTFPRGQMGLRILLYLAVQGETGASADSIDARVWPLSEGDDDDEFDETGAANKVRQAVKRLRQFLARALPADMEPVLYEGGVYQVNPLVIWSDAAAFRACVSAAGVGRRRRLPDAEVLPLLREALGYHTAEFAAHIPAGWLDPVWLDQQRYVFQEQTREAALWAAAILARAGDYAGAVTIYRQLRTVVPVDDTVVEYELICQALRGDRDRLVRSFEEHVAALARVHKTPWHSTLTLYQHLLAGSVTEEMRERVLNPDHEP